MPEKMKINLDFRQELMYNGGGKQKFFDSVRRSVQRYGQLLKLR
jgi:hypothetical protein